MSFPYRIGLAVCLGLATLTGCTAASGPDPQNRETMGDMEIHQMVVASWWQEHQRALSAPDVSVSDGIVSLTGSVDTPQMRVDAVREAWRPLAVSQVVNELEVAQNATQSDHKDQATTIKLRTRLTFDSDIQSTNYSIETVSGTIYLMGVARDDAELAKVQKMAEGIAGPGKVVSYVRLKRLVASQ